MVTEGICLDIVLALYGNTMTSKREFNLEDKAGAQPLVHEGQHEHALMPAHVYRLFLAQYSLDTIRDNLEWLKLTGHIGLTMVGGLRGLEMLQLTPAGVEVARSRQFSGENRELLYTEDPYAVFVARQFADADGPLYDELEKGLAGAGFSVLDGRVDGLAAFRGEILRKIRKARFFVCLLTHRSRLEDGTFASSVWLYQETGAAVALGKMPLVLVEAGMHEHYAGELQKNYEYVGFVRDRFAEAVPETVRRLDGDLTANHIPLPKSATAVG